MRLISSMADELDAFFDDTTARGPVARTATHSWRGLQDHHAQTGLLQHKCGRQAAKAGTNDGYVGRDSRQWCGANGGYVGRDPR